LPFLGLGRPDAHYPIMRSSTPTEDGLWSSCDIAPRRMRVVPRYDRPRLPRAAGKGRQWPRSTPCEDRLKDVTWDAP
jgi:hypothetical protein